MSSHAAEETCTVELVLPDSYDEAKHHYPRALSAQLHPLVASFLELGNARIASRYCNLRPRVNEEALLRILNTPTEHFVWSGADLLNVTNAQGHRQMIVIETNSCPSGMKSFPCRNADASDKRNSGYHRFMASCFKHRLAEHERAAAQLPLDHARASASMLSLPPLGGGLAVLYDKNEMETLGYASAMADVLREPVYWVMLKESDKNSPARWTDGVLHIKTPTGEWVPIRACMRYVTQAPWTRIPVQSKTLVVNAVVACLGGGRNKMSADNAYEIFNRREESAGSGLAVRRPDTVRDVPKALVPMWVKSMGHAVVKDPYSNAGQGVYTITSTRELDAFMATTHRYDHFIVQSLVGSSSWASVGKEAQFFHTGTVPNHALETFVADLRFVVCCDANGFLPLGMYARRAEKPLLDDLSLNNDSWSMLGTNLSLKTSSGAWATDTSRLLLMDAQDFPTLGLGIDDLVDAYVQSVLATYAIDLQCRSLIKADGSFDSELYASLNRDQTQLEEILLC